MVVGILVLSGCSLSQIWRGHQLVGVRLGVSRSPTWLSTLTRDSER